MILATRPGACICRKETGFKVNKRGFSKPKKLLAKASRTVRVVQDSVNRQPCGSALLPSCKFEIASTAALVGAVCHAKERSNNTPSDNRTFPRRPERPTSLMQEFILHTNQATWWLS